MIGQGMIYTFNSNTNIMMITDANSAEVIAEEDFTPHGGFETPEDFRLHIQEFHKIFINGNYTSIDLSYLNGEMLKGCVEIDLNLLRN
jgi:hypothetical protein